VFIAIAPKLLAATRTAMLLWKLATGGDATFTEVPSCELVKGEPCTSVDPTRAMPGDRVGETYKYDSQYIVLVLESNTVEVPVTEVVAHELGHIILGLRYHSKPDTSIMSPRVGPKCLTLEDAERYGLIYNRKLTLWCLPP